MRLWHKYLIPVLPDKQLLSQWRECVAIASMLKSKGTPNHMLVNKVLNFNKSHFYNYCCMVVDEMYKRNFKVKESSRQKILDWVDDEERQIGASIEKSDLFYGWHNDDYLIQCFFNLQEKYQCDGMSRCDYEDIKEKVISLIGEVIILG